MFELKKKTFRDETHYITINCLQNLSDAYYVYFPGIFNEITCAEM